MVKTRQFGFCFNDIIEIDDNKVTYIYHLIFLVLKHCLLILCTFLLFACSSNEDKRASFKTSELNAKIICPAGDIPEELNLLDIPSFFNIAVLNIGGKDIKVIIPTERIEKGKSVGVDPVAQLSFRKDSTLHTYLLSSPALDTLANQKVGAKQKSNRELTELKRIIKSWFMSNCEYGDCKNFKWKNDFQTKAVLNSMVDQKFK